MRLCLASVFQSIQATVQCSRTSSKNPVSHPGHLRTFNDIWSKSQQILANSEKFAKSQNGADKFDFFAAHSALIK